MSWYLELQGLTDVAAFARYINNTDPALKKVMPQILRIRQLQLGRDDIAGTWQSKTPERRVAELFCSYGHGQKVKVEIVGGQQVQSAIEHDPFDKCVREHIGRWVRVCEDIVKATETDPRRPSSPRDPNYYAIAAEKLAAHKTVAALGPITGNQSIRAVLDLMASAADEWNDIVEEAYQRFRRHASEQAARDYADQMRQQDEARLDKTTVKALAAMRSHQKMKLDGKFLGIKGGHDDGNFWMLERAIDGRPILLVSSKSDKDIDGGFVGKATSMASAMGCVVITGQYSQDTKANEIRFFVITGQTQTPMFAAAMDAIGAKGRKVLSAPHSSYWKA